jgi:peptide deformylase
MAVDGSAPGPYLTVKYEGLAGIMALLDIIVAPDPRLKKKAAAVARVDAATAKLMANMLETMYDAPGVGLAAPQVGVLKRIIVVDPAREGEPPQPHMMANPEIVWASEETKLHDEGCLSLPEEYEPVSRPARIKVRYVDEHNEIRTIEADGLLAVIIQHEMDHLDGVLFVDHISALKRNIILRRLTKQKKLGKSSKRHALEPA